MCKMNYFAIAAFMCLWLVCHCHPALQIVNGIEVEPHSMPFVAFLQSEINGRTVRCGGSLISVDQILTAASCVHEADSVNIILGAHNLDEEEATQLELTSSNFTIHESYDDQKRINDIAIINLEKPVNLTDEIGLISTPPLSDILLTFVDELGTVAGWGITADTNTTYSNVLRKIQATVIPYLACTIPYFGGVQTSQICLTGMQGSQNICRGDAGSPLIIDNLQVGIASYGTDFSCSIGAPGVYTRLTSFYFWLLKYKHSN